VFTKFKSALNDIKVEMADKETPIDEDLEPDEYEKQCLE
jgi:hypothetical protein